MDSIRHIYVCDGALGGGKTVTDEYAKFIKDFSQFLSSIDMQEGAHSFNIQIYKINKNEYLFAKPCLIKVEDEDDIRIKN